MYVEALGNIKHAEARHPLAICAIDDDVEEVRLSCLDELQKQKDDAVTKYFVGRMRDKNATNEIINRAGVALGRIKDPSCIATLIDYLVTTQMEVIPNAGWTGRDERGVQQEGRRRRRPGHESEADDHHPHHAEPGRARCLGGDHRPELRL